MRPKIPERIGAWPLELPDSLRPQHQGCGPLDRIATQVPGEDSTIRAEQPDGSRPGKSILVEELVPDIPAYTGVQPVPSALGYQRPGPVALKIEADSQHGEPPAFSQELVQGSQGPRLRQADVRSE